MYALIQGDDIKAQELSRHMDNNVDLVNMAGSPIIIPIHIVKQLLKRKKKPKAVILRYLNDYKSFTKSIFRFFADIFTVLLVKILRTKLIWLCHNVDKESREVHPTLMGIRKKLIIQTSNKILVTDKLMIREASRLLNVNKSKIDFITFGTPTLLSEIDIHDDIHQKILNFIYSDRKENTFLGFSLGNPNKKVLHPFYIEELIRVAAENDINIKMILGGPLGDFIKQYDFSEYENLLTNPNILFLDGKIKINESYISQYVDFYWRVYNDYSIPFTIYNTVFLKKPILTMNKGFLPKMVLNYDLGSVLENDMSNIVEVMNSIKKNRENKYNNFIKTHNWSVGAKKLYKAIIKN